MVLREYKCSNCGKSVTVLFKTSVEIVPDCEFCAGSLEKKLSSFSAVTGKPESLDADYVVSADKVDEVGFVLTYDGEPYAVVKIEAYDVEKVRNPNFN